MYILYLLLVIRENKTPYKMVSKPCCGSHFSPKPFFFFLINTNKRSRARGRLGMSLQAPFQTSFKHHFNAVQASFFGEEHRFGVVSGNGSSAGALWRVVRDRQRKRCSDAVLAPLPEEDWDTVLASFFGRERHLGDGKALQRHSSIVLPPFRRRFGTTDDATTGRCSPTLSMLFLEPLMAL